MIDHLMFEGGVEFSPVLSAICLILCVLIPVSYVIRNKLSLVQLRVCSILDTFYFERKDKMDRNLGVAMKEEFKYCLMALLSQIRSITVIDKMINWLESFFYGASSAA